MSSFTHRLRPLVAPALLALVLAAPAGAQLAPFNDDGLTYGHVHLNVTDVEAHAEIWSGIFGGERIDRAFLTTFKYPNFLLVLSEREPTAPSQETVMDHFGFKVRDVEAVLERWRAAGHDVQAEFTGAEGFPNAYLVAPDGVRFELQEDPELDEEVAGYHVHWFTSDYEEILDWYVEVFGAERFQRGSIETTANVPGQNLSFGDTRTERIGSQGAAIDHIGFEVEDLDAFARELEAKGIELDMEPREVESLGLKIAFLTDPSGVYIELTEGFDEY